MEQIDIIEYGSQATSQQLAHGSATKRELAAVILAFRKCFQKLAGRHFVLFTDHQPLIWLFNTKHTSPMLYRWVDLVMMLNFDVVHVRGEFNIVADALSRSSAIGPAPHQLNNLEEEGPMGIELVTPEMKALLKNKKIPQPAERKQIITDAHSQGHMGIQQTFLRIWHKGFWWPSVRQDIADHLSGCLQCLRFSVRREGFHPLTPIIEDWPGNGWSMDLFFLDKSTNKNVVLIAIDIATGFILDLAPVLSKDKHTIAEEVWKIICTYGPPKYIISDNGAEFVNRHMKALLDKIGVVHRTIASYHPQANGKVERTIKDVKEMIRKMSDADYRFSPSYLPYCKLCYNTHLSSRTNSSPFSLMFGREALAFDNYLGSAEMLPADIAKIQKHWNERGCILQFRTSSRIVNLSVPQSGTLLTM